MPIRASLPRIQMGAMTRVPKDLLVDVEQEKQNLTIASATYQRLVKMGYNTSDFSEFFYLYSEDQSSLYIPRAYKPRLRLEVKRGVDYVVSNSVSLNYERTELGTDNVVLGPNEHQPWDQQPAFDALIAGPSWPYGKVLALRCGAGKTAIALKGAHYRGARTLWVTVNTSLLEQAKRDITRWLGIPEKEIGHIQAGKERWEGCGIAVSMLHSLVRHKYPPAFWDYWQLVIFDEGDVLAAEQFIKVVGRFRAERWLLTATPKRADRMEKMFHLHVGPICYEYLVYDLKPDCYFVQTKCTSEKHLKRAGWDARRGEKRVNFPLTARSLLFDDERNELLFRMVERATENDRTCLVLGDSVDGLIYTSTEARKRLPHLTHGLVVGSVSQKKRTQIIQENKVVWATSQLAYRGLDRPAFDTLLVATIAGVNVPRWRQAVGRVLRTQPGKKPPIVVVLSDEKIVPLAMQTAKLAMLFKKEGWPINNAESLIRDYRVRVQAYRAMEKENE